MCEGSCSRHEVASHGGLICISSLTQDVEHLFIFLLAICLLLWSNAELFVYFGK